DTAYTMRCEGDDHEPWRFGTYSAIAIAKIGKLPSALQDRSLVIQMQRRRGDEKIDRFREDRATDLIELQRKAIRFVNDNLSVLRTAELEMPSGLNDRAADNWQTMLAIADVAGAHWPDTARRVAVTMSGDEEDTTPLPLLLLHDLDEIFAECGS